MAFLVSNQKLISGIKCLEIDIDIDIPEILIEIDTPAQNYFSSILQLVLL